MKRTTGEKIAVALVAVAGMASTVSAEEVRAWRIFVADHDEAIVRAFDLDDGALLGAFAFDEPPAIFRGPFGSLVYAVEAGAGRVSAIYSGISFDDHGDHMDIEIVAPAMTEWAIAGEAPAQVVSHGGRVGVFFDGEGAARLVRESAFGVDGTPSLVVTGSPHRGAAASIADHILVSTPDAGDPEGLPTGLRILDGRGVRVGEPHPCPQLHGAASLGNRLAFACATGFLLVEPSGEAPAVTAFPYGGLPQGRATALEGSIGGRFVLGDFGSDAVVIFGPSAPEPVRLVSLPSARLDFVIDPANPATAYILTADGRLNELDLATGQLGRSVPVTGPYERTAATPQLTFADRLLAITDPDAGVVRLVAPETLAEQRTIATGGAPSGIVAVGGAAEAH